MILYCLEHGGAIIRAIVHKFRYHPQDEAIFFVNKDISSPYCPPIDKVKYYEEPAPWEIAGHYPDSQEDTKKYTDQVLSEFFKEVELDPHQFSHIYAIADVYNPFVLYFEMHSIKYMLIEMHAGQFRSHTTISTLNLNHAEKKAYNRLSVDMHLQDGQGANCIKAFIFSDESQLPKGFSVPFEIFGFRDTIFNLDAEYKRQIVKAYGLDKIKLDTLMGLNAPDYVKGAFNICATNIPSKFTKDNIYGGVYYYYKTIIDYYYRDIDFILKLHPEADEKYEAAFSEFEQLPRSIPTETLFFLEKKFNVIAPVQNTVIKTFQPHDYNVSFLSESPIPLTQFFEKLHFVFLAFTLINAIGKPMRIPAYNINLEQLSTFRDWAYKDFEGVEFINLDDVSIRYNGFIIAEPSPSFSEIIKYVPIDCLIIAHGNVEADPIFAKQKMIYSVIDLSDGNEDVVQTHYWTLLSKSKPLMNMVKEFSAFYTLDHAKVRIESSPCN